MACSDMVRSWMLALESGSSSCSSSCSSWAAVENTLERGAEHVLTLLARGAAARPADWESAGRTLALTFLGAATACLPQWQASCSAQAEAAARAVQCANTALLELVGAVLQWADDAATSHECHTALATAVLGLPAVLADAVDRIQSDQAPGSLGLAAATSVCIIVRLTLASAAAEAVLRDELVVPDPDPEHSVVFTAAVDRAFHVAAATLDPAPVLRTRLGWALQGAAMGAASAFAAGRDRLDWFAFEQLGHMAPAPRAVTAMAPICRASTAFGGMLLALFRNACMRRDACDTWPAAGSFTVWLDTCAKHNGGLLTAADLAMLCSASAHSSGRGNHDDLIIQIPAVVKWVDAAWAGICEDAASSAAAAAARDGAACALVGLVQQMAQAAMYADAKADAGASRKCLTAVTHAACKLRSMLVGGKRPLVSRASPDFGGTAPLLPAAVATLLPVCTLLQAKKWAPAHAKMLAGPALVMAALAYVAESADSANPSPSGANVLARLTLAVKPAFQRHASASAATSAAAEGVAAAAAEKDAAALFAAESATLDVVLSCDDDSDAYRSAYLAWQEACVANFAALAAARAARATADAAAAAAHSRCCGPEWQQAAQDWEAVVSALCCTNSTPAAPDAAILFCARILLPLVARRLGGDGKIPKTFVSQVNALHCKGLACVTAGTAVPELLYDACVTACSDSAAAVLSSAIADANSRAAGAWRHALHHVHGQQQQVVHNPALPAFLRVMAHVCSRSAEVQQADSAHFESLCGRLVV